MENTKVNISKQEEQSEPQVSTDNTVYNQSQPKINLEKVHEAENQVTEALESDIQSAADAVQQVFDKVTDRFNSAINQSENMGQPQQQNYDQPYQQNGQPYQQNGQPYQQNGQPYQQNGQPYQQNGQPYQQNGQPYQQNGQPYQQNGQPYQQNGQPLNVITPDKLKLEPALAALVSVLLCGLGQMLNGQLEKGLVILIIGLVVIPLIAVVTCGIGAILSLPFLVLQAIDAYKCAQILQSGKPIGKYEYHLI